MKVGAGGHPATDIRGHPGDCNSDVLSPPTLCHTRTSNWQIHLQGPSEQKLVENFRPKGPWAYPGTPQFCGVPSIISGTGKSHGRQLRQIHLQGPSEQKPVKKFREKGPWAYPGSPQLFGVPPIAQERAKPRTSNSADTFTGCI